MSVSVELAMRACASNVAGDAVWLAPGLAHLRAALAARAPHLSWRTGPGPEPIALALLSPVDPADERALPAAERWALLCEGLLGGSTAALRAAEQVRPRPLRIHGPEATLELTRAGQLVIRELAPGLSARDLQARITHPLLAGPDLRAMPALPSGP